MLRTIQNWYYRKKLIDKRFDFLFEENEGDEVVVFDTETSGLDPKKDEILSIGAVKVKGNKILTDRKLVLMLKPSMEINAASIKIHHIRHCDLVGAMDPKSAIEAFLYFIGSRPLVGYYLEFDVAMVNTYLRRMLGITLPNRQIEISGLYHDKKIAMIPQGMIDLRFDTIMRDLELPFFGKHDSFNDAIMTAMIYVKLMNTPRLTSRSFVG